MSINILSGEVDILGEACKQTKSYDQLRRNVQQHVLLISLMNDVQSILSFIVLDMFVTCEFMLCLCSFQIYQIYSTTSFVSLMKNICMLAALIVHEFVYFFFGQRLVSKTQDLHRSVYFCEWYNETKSFKNSMNIVHLRMNKPFTILAGKIIPVTLASFITCLKAAFSYFNLLRALSHT
ncbi:odorant receptor 23a-like isoform X2 [Nilaparvata lugens]|uniref:odorant receptor 23a-like isoform X2 n=1 Tax=Nilaparvata lugens TaxID=108931 RepID=UPI00193CD97E|nr:odorant receptor 23a-like isoform X2 [Nilaparvata lugens]